MESSPGASDPEGGVATMPASDLRSLIASSQGPRPLSSVFAYRATRMHPPNVLRAHYVPAVSSTGVPMPIASRAGGPAGMLEEDERKPPPRIDGHTSGTNAIHSDADALANDDDMPALTRRADTDSDSSSTSPNNGRDTSISAPVTRSARKRRGEASAPPAKRPATAEEKPVANLKVDPDEYSDAGSCCICMCDPDEGERATIDGCDHEFCFGCIEKWGERENTCPLCKNRFTRINRHGKRKKGQKGTKKVKQRDQRADLNPGSALEGLLAGLHTNSGFSSSIARLIFSGLGPTSGGVIDFGANPSNASGLSRRVSRQVRWRNPPRVEDALFSDNEDDASDDGSRGYSDFVNSMRRMNQRSTNSVFGGYPLISSAPLRGGLVTRTGFAMPAALTPGTTRSYATNAHDANAGGTADNALEIEDDSDDEVEVIDVRSTAGRNV